MHGPRRGAEQSGYEVCMRNLYLQVARVTAELVADPSLSERWEDKSVLPHFAVGGLAGHLARSAFRWSGTSTRPSPPRSPLPPSSTTRTSKA